MDQDLPEPGVNLLKYDFTGEIEDGMLVGWESKFDTAVLGENIIFDFDTEREEWILNLHRDVGDKKPAIVVQSDPVPVVPGIEYAALAEVRSEDDAKARIHIEFLDENGERTGGSPSKEIVSSTWVPLSVQHVAPEDAVSGRLFFFLFTDVYGDTYFRDPQFVRNK